MLFSAYYASKKHLFIDRIFGGDAWREPLVLLVAFPIVKMQIEMAFKCSKVVFFSLLEDLYKQTPTVVLLQLGKLKSKKSRSNQRFAEIHRK